MAHYKVVKEIAESRMLGKYVVMVVHEVQSELVHFYVSKTRLVDHGGTGGEEGGEGDGEKALRIVFINRGEANSGPLKRICGIGMRCFQVGMNCIKFCI